LKTANRPETGGWNGLTTMTVANSQSFPARNARGRAIRYADRQYGDFEEISLSRFPVIGCSTWSPHNPVNIASRRGEFARNIGGFV
jgi:hypothetical protein